MTVIQRGLFNFIDPPTPDHLEVCVEEAFCHIDFPWHRIIPGLRFRQRPSIDVVWTALPNMGLLGQYEKFPVKISIADWHPLSGMPFTFVHEVGHAVDALTLPDHQRRKIRDFWTPLSDTNPSGAHAQPHDCTTWNKPGDPYTFRHVESYADAFVAAFCPFVWGERLPYNRFVHWPVDFSNVQTAPPVTHYDEIRRLTLEEPIMAFTDVPATHPHAEGINWAAGQGIIGGYPDGKFKPDVRVTDAAGNVRTDIKVEGIVSRGQFATMLKKYHEQQQ